MTTTDTKSNAPAEDTRHEHQVLTGRVTSAKMEKTIVVEGLRLVKQRRVMKAVMERMRNERRRRDATSFRFDDNAAVLINDAGEPAGTRVFGPVARELREKKFAKIVSLAPEVW